MGIISKAARKLASKDELTVYINAKDCVTTYDKEEGRAIIPAVEVTATDALIRVVGGTSQNPDLMLDTISNTISDRFDADDEFFIKYTPTVFVAEVVDENYKGDNSYKYNEMLDELKEFFVKCASRSAKVNDYDRVCNICDNQKAKIDELMETKAALEADFAKLQADYDQIKSEASPDILDATKARIKELEGAYTDAQAEVADLKMQLSAANKDKDELKEKLTDAEAEAAKTKTVKKPANPKAKSETKPATKPKSDDSETPKPKTKKPAAKKITAKTLKEGYIEEEEDNLVSPEEEKPAEKPEPRKPITACQDAISAIFGKK